MFAPRNLGSVMKQFTKLSSRLDKLIAEKEKASDNLEKTIEQLEAKLNQHASEIVAASRIKRNIDEMFS